MLFFKRPPTISNKIYTRNKRLSEREAECHKSRKFARCDRIDDVFLIDPMNITLCKVISLYLKELHLFVVKSWFMKSVTQEFFSFIWFSVCVIAHALLIRLSWNWSWTSKAVRVCWMFAITANKIFNVSGYPNRRYTYIPWQHDQQRKLHRHNSNAKLMHKDDDAKCETNCMPSTFDLCNIEAKPRNTNSKTFKLRAFLWLIRYCFISISNLFLDGSNFFFVRTKTYIHIIFGFGITRFFSKRFVLDVKMLIVTSILLYTQTMVITIYASSTYR